MKNFLVGATIIICILLATMSISNAAFENEKQELQTEVSSTKSTIDKIKQEGSYYSQTTKDKYNSSISDFKTWYNTNNKSIMYLPYLDVKILDFFSGIIITIFIIRISVKFLAKKR